MAQIEVVRQRVIQADPEDVFDALADYREVHPRLLPEQFTDYELREGGDGAGTVVHVLFKATEKRVRDCLLEVSEPEKGTLVEKDRNSTLVTTFTVAPAPGEGGKTGSRVTIRTTWQGAGGVGGFFERLFAPRALASVYDRVLANLAAEMARQEPGR